MVGGLVGGLVGWSGGWSGGGGGGGGAHQTRAGEGVRAEPTEGLGLNIGLFKEIRQVIIQKKAGAPTSLQLISDDLVTDQAQRKVMVTMAF